MCARAKHFIFFSSYSSCSCFPPESLTKPREGGKKELSGVNNLNLAPRCGNSLDDTATGGKKPWEDAAGPKGRTRGLSVRRRPPIIFLPPRRSPWKSIPCTPLSSRPLKVDLRPPIRLLLLPIYQRSIRR